MQYNYMYCDSIPPLSQLLAPLLVCFSLLFDLPSFAFLKKGNGITDCSQRRHWLRRRVCLEADC